MKIKINKIISYSALIISILLLILDTYIIIDNPALSLFFFFMVGVFVCVHLPLFVLEYFTYKIFVKSNHEIRTSALIKKLHIFFTIFQIFSYALITTFYIPVVQILSGLVFIYGGFILVFAHAILLVVLFFKLIPNENS